MTCFPHFHIGYVGFSVENKYLTCWNRNIEIMQQIYIMQESRRLMNYLKLWNIPIQSSDHIYAGVILIHDEENHIWINFDFRNADEEIFHGSIHFQGIQAYKQVSYAFRNNNYPIGFGELYEIEDSEWLNELKTSNPKWEKTYYHPFSERRDIDEHMPHHFVIDFGGYGIYEIISTYIKISPILPGSYEESFD